MAKYLLIPGLVHIYIQISFHLVGYKLQNNQAHSGHLVYNGELELQNLLFKSKNSVTQKRSVCTSLKFLSTSNMFGKT
jgi:hypothetical protein